MSKYWTDGKGGFATAKLGDEYRECTEAEGFAEDATRAVRRQARVDRTQLRKEVKEEQLVQLLLSATPQNLNAYVQGNVTSLQEARDLMGRMLRVLQVLVRREFG